jgi:DNA-binding IclR family transcriptional regulator
MSQVLERALKILERLGDGPATIGELARLLDVHYSTTHRLLQDLEGRRFVYRLHDGTYRIGSGLFYLAQKTLDGLDVRSVATPLMRALRDATGETVHLGQLENGHVVYIEQVASQHTVRMYASIGLSAPMHATAVAKAIVAFQPEALRRSLIGPDPLRRFTSTTITTVARVEEEFAQIQQNGYAVDREEHEDGIHCVAAPIRNADGSVRWSLSVSVPVMRMDRARLMECLPAVTETAAAISREMGAASAGHSNHTGLD